MYTYISIETHINRYFVNFLFRAEHIKLHEQHRGHESMHAEMMLILLVTLAIAQLVLVEWKKRHFKSYQVIISTY